MCPSAANDEQGSFLELIGSWIKARLSEREHSFGSLVAALPGVDPIAVAAALRELARREHKGAAAAASLLKDAEQAPATAITTRERPLPHPLDFYWAHTPESIDLLVGELACFAQPPTTIAYLGTPNIFSAAAKSLHDQNHVLLDRSVPRPAALSNGAGRVVRLDLLHDELPALNAGAAVLDPPWYPDHMRSFLWAAARVIRVGADLWVSFPPIGTRSTVAHETSAVLEWAAQGGLELVERRPGAIRYRSSPFELASHRAAGLGGIPSDWRTGELVRLRLCRRLPHARPPAPPDEAVWLPFAIHEIPVWVRERQPDLDSIGPQLLRSIAPGDVLRTVSRRDPRRAHVDIWTSLNRVWASSHPPVLQAISRALAEGSDPIAAVEADLTRRLGSAERQHVRAVADHLSEVVRGEREEHGL